MKNDYYMYFDFLFRMVRKSALKARKKLKNLIDDISGDTSDIEGYAESSGHEYDIRKDGDDEEENSSSEDSENDIPLANFKRKSKENEKEKDESDDISA
jgi:hypothetical protein